jgi:hypothetical protein
LLAIPTLNGNYGIVWENESPEYLGVGFSKEELLVIGNGDSPLIVLGDTLLWVGAVLAIIFSIVVFLALRKFLCGRPQRSSFSIDIAVLLVLFTASVVSHFYTEYFISGYLGNGVMSFLLLTYLPLLLWLSFTLRQGGVVSIGSTVGLFSAVVLVPLIMGLLVAAFGGSNARYVTGEGNRSAYAQPYEILNPSGMNTGLVIVALTLLLIVLWWNFGFFSQEIEHQTLSTTSSSVNSLSVVSFILSWIPLTSIPANILGHMAYDQILHDSKPQRGIGLSRAAIVLSYLSIAAGGFVIYAIWFKQG